MPSQKVGPLGYVGPHQEWHQPHNSSPSSRSSSWKPRPLKQMHQISSPDQLLRVHPGCITLLVSSKPWVNTFPNHIYCHNLGDPSQVLDARAWTIGEGINNFGQPPGKTLFPRWENSRVFRFFLPCIASCLPKVSFLLLRPQATNLPENLQLVPKQISQNQTAAFPKKKLISFLGQHFSFFGENIPHLRRPDCTKHLSIGGNQLLMHRKVALAISFQPPESLDVSWFQMVHRRFENQWMIRRKMGDWDLPGRMGCLRLILWNTKNVKTYEICHQYQLQLEWRNQL